MAKRRPLSLANYAYILLTVLALQFLGLAGLIVGQLVAGNVGADDLLAMLFVLRGTHKYVKSNEEYKDYRAYLAAREKHWEKLRETEGSLETRLTDAEEAAKRIRIQEANAAALREMLGKLEEDLAARRDEIKQQKEELARLRGVLEDERQKEAAQELSEKREKFGKTLSNMDPAELGEYFSSVLRRSPAEGPLESARLMHAYLSGTQIAEVMTEMPGEDRQKILPVLEHKYADLPAEQIVKEWNNRKVQPEEMAEYMRQMIAPVAFRILSRLDPAQKAQVVRILQSSSRQ